MPSDDDIRVGNPERERAIALLNDAFSAGYLDVAEFEERSGRVYGARTRGDLSEVLADLPNGHSLFGAVAAPVPAAASVAASEQIQLNMWDNDSVRRAGVWKVPPSIVVDGSWATLDLDFTRGQFASATVDLHLQVTTTTVKLKVGPDQEVRYDELVKTGWSTLKDKAGPAVRPGGPVIVLSGSIGGMSSLKIKR